MLSTNKLHPSGALEVSAMVRDTKTHEVWLERRQYYGYTKAEAKERYRQHLRDSNLFLVGV